MIAGASGKSRMVAVAEAARGRVSCVEGRRQGMMPEVVFGAIVRVIAYERRK